MAVGVIKTLSTRDRCYYTAEDVMELLGVGRTKAYNTINALRQECIENMNLSKEYPQGRVPKKYFNKRMMIE